VAKTEKLCKQFYLLFPHFPLILITLSFICITALLKKQQKTFYILAYAVGANSLGEEEEEEEEKKMRKRGEKKS
jgi:hypothetical protein